MGKKMEGGKGKGKECGPKQRRGLEFCLPFMCLDLVTATSFATITYEWNSQSSGIIKQMPHNSKHFSFSDSRGNRRRYQHVLCSSMFLYVHRNHTVRDGEPWTATSTFTQLLSPEFKFSVALRPQNVSRFGLAVRR